MSIRIHWELNWWILQAFFFYPIFFFHFVHLMYIGSMNIICIICRLIFIFRLRRCSFRDKYFRLSLVIMNMRNKWSEMDFDYDYTIVHNSSQNNRNLFKYGLILCVRICSTILFIYIHSCDAYCELWTSIKH